jgi:4-amino-4-deoxy-L-arabinose transferase-like glycosyltransferase
MGEGSVNEASSPAWTQPADIWGGDNFERFNRSERWWTLRWSIFIFAAALVLRFGFSTWRTWHGDSLESLPDQKEYLRFYNRSDSNGVAFSFYDDSLRQRLFAYRMPGYPAFVLFCNGSTWSIRGAQAFLDAATSIFALWIGRRVAGEAIGRLASAGVAFNPYLIYFSSLILSETLFTALLALGILGLLSPRISSRTVAIVVLIASIYVRPSAAGFAAMGSAVAFGWRWHQSRFRIANILLAGMVAGGLTIAALAPWAVRNELVLGKKIWLTTNDGYTWYDSFNPQADGSSNQAIFRNDADLWYRGEVGRSDYLKQKAIDYAVSHPGRVVRLAFAKLARFWSPIPLSADFGGRWLYVAVGGLYAIPLFLFAAVGLWRGKLSRRSKLILLLPAIYFSLVHSVFVGSLRYRVPCDVPLAVLAAAGVVSLFERKPAAESA